MPPTPSSRNFDYTMWSGPRDREGLRRDTDNLYDLKSIEEVEVLNEQVKVAIENIEIALELAKNNRGRRNTVDYEDWKERTEYSLKKYQESLKRIEDRYHKLNEDRRRKNARRERLQANLIAAERKRDEASVNAIFQLSKNAGFIEALRKSNLIPPEVWKDLWDDGEQIAFDRRQQFEGVTYRNLDSYIARLQRELDAEGIEDDATG